MALLFTAGGSGAGWGSSAGVAREPAALVFLRTERVFIWLVIDFTPDFTPGHTRDLTADLVRLRRAYSAIDRRKRRAATGAYPPDWHPQYP